MAKEELPRDKKKHYPSSRHDSDCSDSNEISQTSDDRYPKRKVEFKSKYMSIESARYIGRKNRKGEWEDVPVKDKYMHEYLPEVGDNRFNIHRCVDRIWKEDRWILVKRMFGMEFTARLFYEMYLWVAYQSCKDKRANTDVCNKQCWILFGHDWDPKFSQVQVATWDKFDEGLVTRAKVQTFASKATIMGPFAALLGRSADREIQKHHPCVDVEAINFSIADEKGLSHWDFVKTDWHQDSNPNYQQGGASSSWKRY